MSKRKISNDNPNQDYCDLLSELAEYERNVNKNVHKYNAYRNAASVLAQQPKRIKSGDEAKELKGIGKKISQKIQEFIETGKMDKIEKIRANDLTSIINELTKVSGIGPAKATDLAHDGITGVQDLQNHKDRLTHHQLIGLKHFEEFQTRIPRKEMVRWEKTLKTEVENFDSDLVLTICGSYRRGAETSGDIDCLLTHPQVSGEEGEKGLSSPKKGSQSKAKGKGRVGSSNTSSLLATFVDHLKNVGIVTDVLSLGKSKFMGVCRLSSKYLHRRLDILLVPPEQYYCAVLYFTGSDEFNKAMRSHALDMGFTLNEHSLRPLGSTGVAGEPIPINSEEEIFDSLDYPYRDPKARNK